jgi:hypothetical protein
MAREDTPDPGEGEQRRAADDVVRCPRCGAEWQSSAAAAVMRPDSWKCLRCGEPLGDEPRPPAPPSGA